MVEERLPKKLNWVSTGRRHERDQKQMERRHTVEESALWGGDWDDRLRWRLGIERSYHSS
jgi:hypothetical protein